MKTAERVRHITRSHINAALDRIEKPQQMISQMIREMEEAVIDLKNSVSERSESLHTLQLEKKNLEQQAVRWAERARMAAERDRDDLAREALIEKNRVRKALELVEHDLAQYEKLNEEGRASITEIEEKLELVRQRRRTLIQRGEHAAEKKRVNDLLRSTENSTAYRRFLELEERIEKMEAEAELSGVSAPAGYEDEFVSMEQDQAIEAELAELKRRN